MRPLEPAVVRRVPEVRRAVTALGALGVAQGVATVASVLALASVVVAVVGGGDLVRPAVALVASLAVRGGLVWTSERFAARAGVRVVAGVRRLLVGRWLTVGSEPPDPGGPAVTLATTGVAGIEPYVARYLPALVAAAVLPAGVVLVLLVVDWPSAVIAVLTLPLLPLFAALIGARTRDATADRMQAMRSLAGHYLDVVRGLPTLAAHGRADRQVEGVARVSRRHRTATMETLRIAFLSSSALELLATISVALVAVTAGLRLAHGSLDLHTALVAILLAPEAYWPVRRVGAEFHAAAEGQAALADAMAELDRPLLARAGLDDAHVTLSAVTVAHPGSTGPVLDAVDLDLGTGLTVVTGPSGSGKTTLLEVVAGLRDPLAGRARAGRTHLVAQRPLLVPGSLRENLTLGATTDELHLWAGLRAAGFEGVVAGLPRGLDTALGEDGFGLSAGQRARLALARAVVADAPVLLLDEPTAHLDPSTTAHVHETLHALAVDHCVVVVSHEPVPVLTDVIRHDVHLVAGRVDRRVAGREVAR